MTCIKKNERTDEFPEQCEAIYNIVRYLIDKDALSYDPLSVEMTRSGYPSVFPCRSGFPKLDIDQLEWSRNHGWWFTGPVKILKITDIKKEKLSKADIYLLKRLAKKGDFILKID